MDSLNLKFKLKELLKKAQREEDLFLIEEVSMKLVHRFGLNSLTELQEFSEKSKNGNVQFNQMILDRSLIEFANQDVQPSPIPNKLDDVILEGKITNISKELIREKGKLNNLPLPSISSLRKWIKGKNN